jgi:hypothetical protein
MRKKRAIAARNDANAPLPARSGLFAVSGRPPMVERLLFGIQPGNGSRLETMGCQSDKSARTMPDRHGPCAQSIRRRLACCQREEDERCRWGVGRGQSTRRRANRECPRSSRTGVAPAGRAILARKAARAGRREPAAIGHANMPDHCKALFDCPAPGSRGQG